MQSWKVLFLMTGKALPKAWNKCLQVQDAVSGSSAESHWQGAGQSVAAHRCSQTRRLESFGEGCHWRGKAAVTVAISIKICNRCKIDCNCWLEDFPRQAQLYSSTQQSSCKIYFGRVSLLSNFWATWMWRLMRSERSCWAWGMRREWQVLGNLGGLVWGLSPSKQGLRASWWSTSEFQQTLPRKTISLR